ncbi:hypothetical protein ACFL3T_04550 [Patescibacteria group bacterium]
MVHKKEVITEVVQLTDYLPEQSFLEDQEATPVVDLDSNLEELDAFKERIQGLGIAELTEAKYTLLATSTILRDDLPEDATEINVWHQEIYRLVELTQAKLKAVSDLITERSST